MNVRVALWRESGCVGAQAVPGLMKLNGQICALRPDGKGGFTAPPATHKQSTPAWRNAPSLATSPATARREFQNNQICRMDLCATLRATGRWLAVDKAGPRPEEVHRLNNQEPFPASVLVTVHATRAIAVVEPYCESSNLRFLDIYLAD